MQCWEHAWWPRGAATWFNDAELGALEAEHQGLIERNHGAWSEAMCLLEVQGEFYQLNETAEHRSIQQFDEQRQFLHTPQREFLIQQAAHLLEKLPEENRDAIDAALMNFVLSERAITPVTSCSTPCTPHKRKRKELLWPRPWQPPFSRQKAESDEVLVARALELEHHFLITRLLPHLERAMHIEDDRHAKQKSRLTVPTTQALKGYVEKLEQTINIGPAPKVPLKLRSLCSSFRSSSENVAAFTGENVTSPLADRKAETPFASLALSQFSGKQDASSLFFGNPFDKVQCLS